MSSSLPADTALPATRDTSCPSSPSITPLWETVIPAGTHWSAVLRRGLALRIVDIEGGANLAAVFYRQEDPLERYNMADTLKAQHTAHLTRGHVLYSDMGRVMASITADTLGWHDPLGGVGDAALFAHKYGTARYQTHRNDMIRNGRDSLVLELAKYGLGERDLVANVNFFSKVAVGEHGALEFVPGHSFAGSAFDLRFEMNTLAAFSTAPHPLDPRTQYEPKPVRVIAYRAYAADASAPADDPCRTACPENTRGFINTDRLFA
jgi:urea carboxylase-associated protein 2